MTEAVEISASDFHKEVLESDEPVVVEFFSHSCPHCRKFNAVYKELTEVMDGHAKFVKIDVVTEQNRILAHNRGVRTVPTLEVFYRGRVIGNVVGYHHLEKISKAIREFLSRKEENIGPGTPLKGLHKQTALELTTKFSIAGCQIRWFKKTALSEERRQLIKQSLRGMSAILEKAMNCTREEALENRVAEIRLTVNRSVYLVVEYCQDGWHLGLETYSEPIGEIVRKGEPFIEEFDDKEVERETI